MADLVSTHYLLQITVILRLVFIYSKSLICYIYKCTIFRGETFLQSLLQNKDRNEVKTGIGFIKIKNKIIIGL